MTDYKTKFTPHALKTTVIQISSYVDKNFVGTVQNPHYKELKVFSNLTQMLLIIEELQNELNYPQKCLEPRTLKDGDPPQVECPEIPTPLDNPIATFQLRILFRQNASWQGSILWMDEGLEAQFRSALELVSMMDSVLN